MDLQELKRLIDYAVDDCQQIILDNPKAVLSEGDFERLLSDCISKRIGYCIASPNPNEFGVYSQLSHYSNAKDELDARVDILLAKPIEIIPDLSHNKKFKIYNPKESFAIELKYRHDNNRGCVTEAKKDIKKYFKYKDDSHYYAIILLDMNRNTDKHVKEIQDFFEAKKTELESEDKNKFFCKVLIKQQNDKIR